jgi:hypothetical protein
MLSDSRTSFVKAIVRKPHGDTVIGLAVENAALPYIGFGPLDLALSYFSSIGCANEKCTVESLVARTTDMRKDFSDIALVDPAVVPIRLVSAGEAADTTIVFNQIAGTIGITHPDFRKVTHEAWTAKLFAAGIESRTMGRFFEETDDSDGFKRAKIWMAACLSVADLLPCEKEAFFEAADLVSVAIAPKVDWSGTPESASARLLEAVRAGIVMMSARTGLLIPHPSLPAWRESIAASSDPMWSTVAQAARGIPALPTAVKNGIKAWAEELDGRVPATAHDLLSAGEFFDDNKEALRLMGTVIVGKLPHFPSTPPTPRAFI